MLMLTQCPPVCLSITLLIQFVLCLGAIYCFLKACHQHLPAKYLLLFIANLSLQYFMTQLLLEYVRADMYGRASLPIARTVDRFPLTAVVLWLVLWIVLTLRSIILLHRYDRQHITPRIIQSSLDDLPTGLCFSRDDGSVILSNRQMEALCLRLTGRGLLSAEILWQAIRDTEEVPSPEDSVILPLDDKVWNISRKRLKTDIGPIWELLAADVSEEYRLIRALEQDNRQLKANGQRLREYAKSVDRLTIENEILNTKIHIHSETGNLLYAAVHSMADRASTADREQTLLRWKQTNRLLQTDSSPRESSSFDDLRDTARDIGVTLVLEGTLPEEKEAEQLCEAIAHECLTNTVRHAHGSRVVLCVEAEESIYTVVCTNNGEVPTEPIREGGGLSSLRRQLERQGGTMNIDSRPVFCLTATIPKGEAHGKDPCFDRGGSGAAPAAFSDVCGRL